MGQVRAGIGMVVCLAASSGIVCAQQSANYQIAEHTFDTGGLALASSSFQLTLSSIGGSPAAVSPSGGSYSMSLGFNAPYLPPGEVSGLAFVDSQTLVWQPEPSLGGYNLYRGVLSGAAAMNFGTCTQQLSDETATDLDPVPPGDGFLYLVAAKNFVAEEGSLGVQSDGAVRSAVVCP